MIIQETIKHWKEIKDKPIPDKPTYKAHHIKNKPAFEKVVEMTIETKQALKRKYNELIKREKKGSKWLDDNMGVATEGQYNLGVQTLANIQNELSDILSQIGSYTPDEIEFGFEILEEQKLL